MMTTRNLLVIGATGKTGRHTTELLLRRGHRVRALVRRIDERSEGPAGLGAEVMVGDALDLGPMARATEGINAAYFTYPILPGLWTPRRTWPRPRRRTVWRRS
ncbi:SDR family oxidoreductase [Streptomyces sp. NPDC088354]|uniref:SDR family oxidoreductase n=1 Tax=unclassified Streptomyces TaxID=2593676 RepID=UPI0029B9B139|nr:NAD(P)H-binding protein [Streptomyces sp. MI02-7b]MDX3071096.1 NAD(P)H-binding protein [Streptomyces sp. MI02-7b]